MSGDNRPAPPKPLSPDEVRAFLDYDNAELIARRDTVIAALDSSVETCPVIDGDDQLGAFAENVSMANALQKEAKTRHVAAKAPYLDGGRAVDSWFGTDTKPGFFGGPLQAAINRCLPIMSAYQARKLEEERRRVRAAAEAARIAAVKADLEAREAARKLAEARFSVSTSIAAGESADKAAQAAQAADDAKKHALAPAQDLTRTRGPLGATATIEEVMEVEITDTSAVDRRFCVPDLALVRAWVRERTQTPEDKAIFRQNLETKGQPWRGIKISVVAKTRIRR